MRFSSLTLTTLVSSALAGQGSNFNVSAAFADAHACDGPCQKTLGRNNAVDLGGVGSSFDFDFYATASNFSGSKPGDLLKLQPVNPDTLQVRAGTTVFRIQYTSLDLDGKTLVPATGFIAFPYAPLATGPRATYRSVAFAHGTIGLYRGCAPSNGPSLFDYNSWQLLVDRGYAVIATDYAGLGNDYVAHKYCSFPAHVNDVYYSMLAARSVFGARLSREWMSVGHSQGGGAVWKLAESRFVQNDADHPYLGTVALAPATHVIDMFFDSLAEDNPKKEDDASSISIVGYTPYLGLGLQRVDASYNLTILGPRLRKRIEVADKAQTCTTAFMGLTVGLEEEDLISQTGLKQDASKFREWQRETAPTSGDSSPQPILVMQGLNDTTVLPSATIQAHERSCKHANEVHLRLYEGAEHSPLLAASAVEWLGWMDARFSGQPTSGNCSSATRRAFGGAEYAKLPSEGALS